MAEDRNVARLAIDIETAYPPKPLARWEADTDQSLTVTLKGKDGKPIVEFIARGKASGKLDLKIEQSE